jgi:ubiquitin-conjugating enzyme E2 A
MRLLSDFASLEEDEPEGCSASPINTDDMYRWTACIFGPDESEWEGGIFQLKISFPIEYPTKPPSVRFTSVMYHPNVYPDGSLCLDLLQDQWSPVYTCGTILTSIRSLLTDPNPASPANPQAAKTFESNIAEYKKNVRKCVARTQDA